MIIHLTKILHETFWKEKNKEMKHMNTKHLHKNSIVVWDGIGSLSVPEFKKKEILFDLANGKSNRSEDSRAGLIAKGDESVISLKWFCW